MKHCIYCRTDKEDTEFTLEHVIPQFLGGAYAPDVLKTRDVCKKCNSNLGLFVDAGFEKTFIVSNWLRESAFAFFDPAQPTGVPLVCVGNSELTPPDFHGEQVCESWLGPFGEQVYWLRPRDERLFWFVGGNPRTVKSIESRAYFMFSERSHKNLQLAWLSFEQAFKGRKVRKIMCTEVSGADPKSIGFSEPDELDFRRIKYFNDQCEQPQVRKNQIAFYTHFDFRFLAKLAIGVSYCLFGKKVLDSTYGKELHKALWHKNGESEMPLVRGTTLLSAPSNPRFNDIVGFPYAVTALIQKSDAGIGLNLNIGAQLNWTVMCAAYDVLQAEDLAKVGHGKIVLLVDSLQRGIYLDLPDYLAHRSGHIQRLDLAEITAKVDRHRAHVKSLLG